MSDFLQALVYNSNNPILFNSVLFILLFTAFYGIYILLSDKIKLRNAWLLLFCLFFYYKLSGNALILLLGMATSDYLIGRGIGAATKLSSKKWLLALSLFINIACLFYFKYTNFFIETWGGISGKTFSFTNIIAPIGISYFIFKSLTYIFDLYRGDIVHAEKNYLNYVLYVSFFPNIMAGPISRASELLPQFSSKPVVTNETIGKALFLILFGLFKKIVIADYIATNFVDRVFDAPSYFTGFESLMASYGATIQLYADFSGYTDIVIGIALLMGFEIAANFNKPFLAQNVTDFWRRWHITLSTWLRDYLFTPLSLGMRNMRTTGLVIAIFITFIICGFWHGANLTFVVWGALHGLAMAWDIYTNKLRSRFKKRHNSGLYKFLSIFITFHFLAFTFLIFKARDLETAQIMLNKIFTSLDFSLSIQWMILYIIPFALMLFALALHYTPMKWYVSIVHFYSRMHWSMKAVAAAIAIVIIYQSYSSEAQPFIYLDF